MTLKEGDSMKVILKGMPFGVTGKVEVGPSNLSGGLILIRREL